MKMQFYVDCIIKDRNTRNFVDFSGEKWFDEFMSTMVTEGKNNSILRPGPWQQNILFTDVDSRESFLNFLLHQTPVAELIEKEEFKKNFTFSKEILDLLCVLDNNVLIGILDNLKNYKLGNCEEHHNQRVFEDVNMPLIRLMDYFLERKAFKQFASAMNKLESAYIKLWFDLTIDKVNQIVKENIENPDLSYLYTRLDEKSFRRYFKKEYISIMKNAPFEAFTQLFDYSCMPQEYISDDFFSAYKGFSLKKQIYLVELMEDDDCTPEIIAKCHELLNKKTDLKSTDDFLYNVFEMSSKKLLNMIKTIKKSSYFLKRNIENTELWKIISLYNVEEYCFDSYIKTIDLSHNYYKDIMDLYRKCREYATQSIVDSLYPLDRLTQKVTHINANHYNIMVRTAGDVCQRITLKKAFEEGVFASFSILCERNFSHYRNGVIYGYYTDITPKSIAHIYPNDSLSTIGSKYESGLSKSINMLLDIDDLNEMTYKRNTYNELILRTKNERGKILLPDCIICIDEVNKESKEEADKLGLNILVLQKSNNTIEYNEDIFKDLH